MHVCADMSFEDFEGLTEDFDPGRPPGYPPGLEERPTSDSDPEHQNPQIKKGKVPP